MVDPRQVSAESLWLGGSEPQASDAVAVDPRFIPWQDLDVPLPHRETRCWGYALTYPEHRRDTLDVAAFRFLKQGSVATNSAPIPFRPFLDFELEIGLLMHRETPNRFGYFLANDLTDRGLQIDHYDRRKPAPGFTLAKSFPGSLRVGPLLVLGDATLWPTLTATLTLNAEARQTLRACDCHLDPARFHRDLFNNHDGEPWLLVVTGTCSGTMFRSPRTRDRLRALLAGGLSVKQARRRWLGRLKFLAPGDVLVLHSPLLGHSETHVV